MSEQVTATTADVLVQAAVQLYKQLVTAYGVYHKATTESQSKQVLSDIHTLTVVLSSFPKELYEKAIKISDNTHRGRSTLVV